MRRAVGVLLPMLPLTHALCSSDEACRLVGVGIFAVYLAPLTVLCLGLSACFPLVRRGMGWLARLLLLYAFFSLYSIFTATRWDLIPFPIGAFAAAALCWYIYTRDKRGEPLCSIALEQSE